jgi:single-strand DNA-binding protein
MADLNSVSFSARVTMPPELRTTKTGTPLVNLRVVINDAVRDEDGSWTQKPNFVNVTVFGPNAENLSRSLTKGSRIAVDGRLSWREWTTDSGSKGQALDVVANNVHYLDTKAEADARRTADTSAPAPGDATEDIPF